MSEQKVKPMRMTTFVDTSLCCDWVIGRPVIGILQVLSQNLIGCVSKMQEIMQVATYRTKFMAARQATELMMIYGIIYGRLKFLFVDHPGCLDTTSQILMIHIPSSGTRQCIVISSYARSYRV